MPRMGPKDYRAIGYALRRAFQTHARDGAIATRYVKEAIADAFESDNPRFDRERFLRFVETGLDTRHETPKEFAVTTKRLTDKGKLIEAKVQAAKTFGRQG